MYLDTSDLVLYGAHLRRMRRWKPRVRSYDATGLRRAEVKVRDARGRTAKIYGHLTSYVIPDDVRQLCHEVLDERERAIADRLEPSMAVSYVRSALVDPERGERITIDRSVQFHRPDGTFAGELLPVWSVIETKSRRPRAHVAATLRALEARPLRTTKYTAAITLAGHRRAVPGSAPDVRRYFRTCV